MVISVIRNTIEIIRPLVQYVHISGYPYLGTLCVACVVVGIIVVLDLTVVVSKIQILGSP